MDREQAVMAVNRRSGRAVVLILAWLGAGTACTSWQRPLPPAGLADQVRGHSLVLRRVLVFPAGETRLYFQHGRQQRAQDLTVWEPHCAWVAYRRPARRWVLAAGRLPVIRARAREELAFWGRGIVSWVTRIDFAPVAGQPLALECERWGYDVYAGPLTAAEFHAAMGDWVQRVP